LRLTFSVTGIYIMVWDCTWKNQHPTKNNISSSPRRINANECYWYILR
jgi:hypothetical protein